MDHCTHEVRAELWFCTNNTKDVYKDMQANPVNIPLRRSRLSGKMETTCPDRRKPL